MVRPSPVPPKRRVVEPSAWVKAENTSFCSAGAIPMPVSTTLKRRMMVSSCAVSSSVRSSTRPAWVNLMALLVRLVSTCSRRNASPFTMLVPKGKGWMMSSIFLLPAAIPIALARLSITSPMRNGMHSASIWPASILETSRMSLMMPSNERPDARILRTRSCASVSSRACSSRYASPRMAFRGERISWLIFAKNSALLRFAASATSRASTKAASACFWPEISCTNTKVAGPSASTTRAVVVNTGTRRPSMPKPIASNICSKGESSRINAS